MHHLALFLLQATGALLLCLAGLHDFGFRTVPNWVSLALLMCGLLLRVLDGYVGWGLLAGPVVFVFAALIWRFGWMGGGDVKLLAAAAVFVPPWLVPSLLIFTSLAGGVLAISYLITGFLVPRPAITKPDGLLRRALRCELWRLRRRGPLPYAAAIAAAGIVVTFLP